MTDLDTKIMLAGSGGQGILFLGKLLARAGMIEGRNVTYFPSYGAEMRGGTANCTLILSDNMIGSPVTLNFDILVAMNSASIEKFQPRLRKNGLLLFDSSLITGFVCIDKTVTVGIPATTMADALGDSKAANMVMLGALIAETGILKKSSFDGLFYCSDRTGDKKAEINMNSILEGIKYIENKKSRYL